MSSWITSRIAMCHNCIWRCEDNDISTHRKAKKHAKNYNHRTSVEVARVYHYD